MRVPKFRAWDLDNKKTEDVTSIDFAPPFTTGKFSVRVFDREGWHKPLYNFILLEYTGFLDKNEVEIYEGDIIEGVHDGDEFKSNVYWDDAGFCVTVANQYFPWLGEIMPIHDSVMKCIEVIGNIYENPELLP